MQMKSVAGHIISTGEEENEKNKRKLLKVYGGDLLMNAGMLIETMRGDYMNRLYHFVLDNSLT